MVEEIIQEVVELNPEALTVDGFDEAIIGYSRGVNIPTVFIYDVEKMIDIMTKKDGMTDMEAMEYFDFNIGGAYMGEGTPIFLHK